MNPEIYFIIADKHERYVAKFGWTSVLSAALLFSPENAAILLGAIPGTYALRVFPHWLEIDATTHRFRR